MYFDNYRWQEITFYCTSLASGNFSCCNLASCVENIQIYSVFVSCWKGQKLFVGCEKSRWWGKLVSFLPRASKIPQNLMEVVINFQQWKGCKNWYLPCMKYCIYWSMGYCTCTSFRGLCFKVIFCSLLLFPRPKGKKVKREKSRSLALRIKPKKQKKDKETKDKEKDKKKKKKTETLSPPQVPSKGVDFLRLEFKIQICLSGCHAFLLILVLRI